MAGGLTLVFPGLALLFAAAAYQFPAPFAVARPAIEPLLGLVMFGMGVGLSVADFRRIADRPRLLLTGLALQFLLMPLFAWLIGVALGLPLSMLVGLVLVGSCPGGTASNVICYLARGDVALSVSLTTLSTVAAVLLTPAMTWLYVGQRVPVPILEMLMSVFKIILLPVVSGIFVNRYLSAATARVRRVLPLVSVMSIVMIIAIIVALNRSQLEHLVMGAAAAVVLHNGLGLLAGYGLSRVLGYDRVISRTLAIEIGMQNSGLGVALAVKYFSTAAAMPGALFSIWHNITGALLAGVWRRRPAAT